MRTLMNTTTKPLNQNNMKQTAVEWLIEYCDKEVGYIPIEIIDQAKEMEMEQKHAEYMRGWKDGLTKQEKK